MPATRIFTIADIFNDPHYARAQLDRRRARRAHGHVAMAGVVPRLSATPGACAMRAAPSARTRARCCASCWATAASIARWNAPA